MLALQSKTKYFLFLIGPLVIIIIWGTVTTTGLVNPIFLPTIPATAMALWHLVISGEIFVALLSSVGLITGATLAATVVGLIIGILMGMSENLNQLLTPITEPVRYLPITALIPLLIVWFGIGTLMKLAFLFLAIVFYFIPLVRNAVRSAPRELTNVARAFGAGRIATFRHVNWPYALPQIFDGLIVINGIGWTYVILAEIINARDGLGYIIYIAGRLQKSDAVFAGLIVVGAIALLSDWLLRRLRQKYFFW